MKFLRYLFIIVVIIGLIKITQNQAGIASAWNYFKASAIKAGQNAIQQAASSVFSKYTTVTPNPKPTVAKTASSSYSLNPRDLSNALTRSGISSAINYGADYLRPYVVSYAVPYAAQFKAAQVAWDTAHVFAHQLDPFLIPKFNEDNLFKKAASSVRVGTNLPAEEELIIERRIGYTQPAIANFLELNLPKEHNIRIGFCGSGGGYRAMLSTVGFLVGAQRIGLLDTALYMSALSGSTWALAPWISMNIPINKYKTQLITKTQGTIGIAGTELLPPPSSSQLAKFLFNLETKYLFHAPITSVDLWGAMIANKLFEPAENRQDIYISNQRNIIADGKHLFPIYTAVNPGDNLTYHWFEFTPFEVGSTSIAAFTPTWAFGRKSLNGKALSYDTVVGDQYAPEQTLGYYLGIFGSAFTVNLDEILGMMKQAEDVKDQDYQSMELKVSVIEEVVKTVAGIKDLKKSRISPAKLFNYTYGLESSPIKAEKQLTLVDAGLAFNLPTPPLLRPERALDVIFIFDSSSDIGMAGELKKAEKYALDNNLPFPPIDYNQAKTKAISIFRDSTNPKVPTIIYMPLIKDDSLPGIKNDHRFASFDPKKCVEKDYCGTFNFKYEPDEFELLTLLTETNIADNEELIKKTFKDILAAKYPNSNHSPEEQIFRDKEGNIIDIDSLDL